MYSEGNEFKNVGFSTLNEILNVVAPPISEHEVIQVWLSHDMEGYDGVESVVYRALARVCLGTHLSISTLTTVSQIMEQVEGGDLVVNKGQESKPRESAVKGQRNMNAVDGLDTAIKLAEVMRNSSGNPSIDGMCAQANIQELIKAKGKETSTPEPTEQNPTRHSYVYLRIQPFHSSLPTPQLIDTAKGAESTKRQQLQFALHLSDPNHQLAHTTVTQAIPGDWIAVLEKHEWVEDLLVEALRVGVEVLGQEYLAARMGWMNGEGVSGKPQGETMQEEKK